MKVICEIRDYSIPAQTNIKVHSARSGGLVELEVDGKRHTVDAEELISAVKRSSLDVFGK